MCSIDVFNAIDNVLIERCNSGESFTTYDVTKLARTKIKDEFLHGEVKQYIAEEMEELIVKGKFVKKLKVEAGWSAWEYQQIPGAYPNVKSVTQKIEDAQEKKKKSDEILAKLKIALQSVPSNINFHVAPVTGPKVDDLKLPPKLNYLQKAGNVVTRVIKAASPPTPGNGVGTIYTSNCVDAKRDKRKRVTLPKGYVEKIGGKSGQGVRIHKINNGRAFVTQEVLINPISEFYTIDSRGNVKISNSVLVNLGFGENDGIKISQVGKRIYLDKK